ncbi:helix-turn-helix domain-containing protein [Pedobacter cryoconitis]|uniref:AraC-like DNA-binding protein n=1 Tax=Pedobacter cryoconitis TaxID=188932 RepID=A0A7X0J077_9SPHI|nr:AraC family transcriptional regulator [Pedobacter cryoconitis]MBB6498510.1 AraC-like DNA-binding protein [Pedobacter cryoconitis]
MNLEYKFVKADYHLSAFVDFFWMITNPSDEEQEVVVLPDGRIDIMFSISSAEPYHIMLMGLGNEPSYNVIAAQSRTFAISFNLLAVEYIPDIHISSFLNSADRLPDDFWAITVDDLNDFEGFCKKVSQKMTAMRNENIDDRIQKLFQLIYATNGTMPVKELSEKVFWSSRQINRYFNQQFGLSLKTYCNILRFRASFPHLKEGKLYPEQNYTDQTHFIKEVKKFAGVIPKELSRNKGDRFIHLTTLTKK